MRKYISVLIILVSVNAQAQLNPVLKNRRGMPILPQQGEYCVGFSANPFLTYFGNMFNGSNGNGSPATSFAANNKMLFGKYMKTNDKAYRASFRFAINSDVISQNVKDLKPGADVNATVVDQQKNSSSFFGIGLGIEKRKGQGRIQGIYGFEGVISYNSGNNIKFDYGNSIENLDTGVIRVKKVKASSLFSIGLRGFAGVEYFIAPKFSIGAEFGYGPSFGFRSVSENTTEQYDFTASAVKEDKSSLSPKTTTFSLDTDNYSGIIKMLFYF